MSDNEIQVRIGGEATGAVAAMSEATASVKAGVEAMNSSLGSLGAAFEKMQGMFMAMTAILAGGEAFKASISAANNWNTQVGAMAKQMGMTTQQASVMSVALHGVGVSTDTYRQAAMMMTRQISSNESAFKTLGVAVKDTHTGALRPISDVMTEVNGKLGSLHNATERNTAGMKVYGRGWSEVQGILKLNASTMQEAQEKAEKLHLIVGPEGVAHSKEYAKTIRELKLDAESLEIAIGEKLLPWMTQLGQWFDGEGESAVEGFSSALNVLDVAFEGTAGVCRDLWTLFSDSASSMADMSSQIFGNKIPGDLSATDKAVATVESAILVFCTAFEEACQAIDIAITGTLAQIERFAQAADAALHGHPLAAIKDWDNATTQINNLIDQKTQRLLKTQSDYRDKWDKIWSSPAKTPTSSGDAASNTPDASGEHLDFSKPKKAKKAKSGGGSDEMAAWKEELEQKKEASGDFFKEDLSMEEAFWQSKLALVKGNSKQEVAERRSIQKELYDIHKQQAQQDRQLDEESIAQEEKLGKADVASAKEVIQAKKDLGQINDVQEVQQLQQLKDQEYQIELKALQDKLALYQMDKLAKQKLLDEIALLEKQHANTSKQSATQVAQAQKKQTESMLSPISSAMDKTITGMIMGTQTLRQSVNNIGQNIIAEFVSVATKRGVAWAAAELSMTTSSETGAALRTALASTSTKTSTAEKATEATAVVSANAAEGASGAAASVAAIPVTGWAMAPGVFASVMAMVLGAKSMIPSARGGFDIPAGVNPLTQLHEKEMVLPAAQADAVRNMASSGGGGMQLHIHALDGASVQRVLMSNGVALTRAMKEQQRRFAK